LIHGFNAFCGAENPGKIPVFRNMRDNEKIAELGVKTAYRIKCKNMKIFE